MTQVFTKILSTKFYLELNCKKIFLPKFCIVQYIKLNSFFNYRQLPNDLFLLQASLIPRLCGFEPTFCNVSLYVIAGNLSF